MTVPVKHVGIIGAGAMGTLCALLLSEKNIKVTLWARSREHVEDMCAHSENIRYMPGHRLSPHVHFTNDISEVFQDTQVIISAIPCQYTRQVWEGITSKVPGGVTVFSVTKGIEVETLKLPTEIISEFIPEGVTGTLSGPSIASEIASRKPASIVSACTDIEVATLMQTLLSNEYFRLYTSTDVKGVELAGAGKNVIALAAGICEGIKAGTNAKAALITRGMVELSRLICALGGKSETVHGLAGIGDLITTCFSEESRNRSAGEKIGVGVTLERVLESTSSVIEGIPTTKSLMQLAQKYNIEMPIVESIYAILFEKRHPEKAVSALMSRNLGAE